MASDGLQVRRLDATDAAIYRDIRLESLVSNPEAFGSTFEWENAQTLTWFAERLESAGVFGAFRGADLIGIAGFSAFEPQKEAHKGTLWGTYVRPGVRRTGIARRLVDAIVAYARGRVELLQLTVVSENKEALQLYTGLGFVEFGLEKHAMKQNGRYYDDVWMTLDLMPCVDQEPRGY